MDKMAREEAIVYMKLYRARLKNSVGDLGEDIKAFDAAIDALGEKACGDCLSRDAVACYVEGLLICTHQRLNLFP